VDYSKLLEKGTKTRINITKNILELLKESFKDTNTDSYRHSQYDEIKIKDIDKNNLEEVLKFSEVPFINAKGTTPTFEEMGELNTKTKFDLTKWSSKKIGEIKYILPYSTPEMKSDEFGGYRTGKDIVDLGHIIIKVFGSEIENEQQYNKISLGLNDNIRKRDEDTFKNKFKEWWNEDDDY
jgi:hypothetical protein